MCEIGMTFTYVPKNPPVILLLVAPVVEYSGDELGRSWSFLLVINDSAISVSDIGATT